MRTCLPQVCDAALSFRGRKGVQVVEDHCATRERFTFETCVQSWAAEDRSFFVTHLTLRSIQSGKILKRKEERPLTAVMFKHGDSRGGDAGRKIKDGIRAKACTSVHTYVNPYVAASQQWAGRCPPPAPGGLAGGTTAVPRLFFLLGE